MVDSAAADRAAEKVRKLVALTASPHLEEARTSAYLACRLIREHGLQVSGHPPSTAFAPGYPTAGVPHRQPTADPHGFRRIRVRHPGHCRCCGKPIALGGVGALVPWQWPATSALHPLSRCSAEEIQQALRALLAGEAFLADRPWSEIWWWRMRLDLASGWQLKIAIERDQLGALLWAQAPDGRDWVYGCQRDDWTLGPDSRIVEPVALLKPEQRQQLEQLLREAICWPAPLVSCGWVMPMGKVKPSPYARRKGRRPVHRPVTSAGQCTTGRASKTGAPTPTPL